MKHLLTSSRAVGICFARQHVGVARVRRSAMRWQLETFVEQELPAPLFEVPATPEALDSLRRSLAELTAGLAKSHMPVQVALPDPAVRAAVFELEELPKSPAAQTSLVEFRFGRESAVATALTSVSQALGQVRGPLNARASLTHLLFGMSMDGRWRETLQGLLRESGVVAWGIAPGALQVFNLFHDRLVERSGAMLQVNSDSWALLLWDEQGRLRHCSAHWRDTSNAANGGDHHAIASEAARLVVAYADAQPERSIEKIFVAGAAEADAVAATLDRRACSPCIRLSVSELLDGCDEQLRSARTGEGALGAALSI